MLFSIYSQFWGQYQCNNWSVCIRRLTTYRLTHPRWWCCVVTDDCYINEGADRLVGDRKLKITTQFKDGIGCLFSSFIYCDRRTKWMDTMNHVDSWGFLCSRRNQDLCVVISLSVSTPRLLLLLHPGTLKVYWKAQLLLLGFLKQWTPISICVTSKLNRLSRSQR